MSIALPTKEPINWTRIIRRFSFAAAAGMLAVAAIVGSGVLANGEQAAPVALSPRASVDVGFAPPPAPYPTMTYFLVDSIDQHDLVVAEQTEITNAIESKGEEHWFSVLIAETPQEAIEAWDFIDNAKADWLRCCQTGRFRVVDLRSP